MGSYAQALQHKQALSDQELEGQIGQLVDNRKAIQAKLPTLLDEKGQPTPQYQQAIDDLTKNAQALREVYHPDKNPTAIQNFGHLLTDALHITKPEDRIQKEAAKRTAAAAGDVRTAQAEAAAAPLSPQQIETQQTTSLIDRQKKLNDAQIQWLRDNRAPQDVIDRAVAAIGGVPNVRGTKAVGQPYQDANDKKWYQRYVDADGTTSQIEIPGFTPVAHTGTAQFNERLAAYARDHGTTVDQLPESAYSYLREKMAREAAVASSNTNTTFKQDASGALIPVTETNYRNPGGGPSLVDPLGPVQSSSQGGATQPQATTTQTPKGIGAKANTQPKAGSTSKPKAAAGGGAGNVKVGEPIMQGRTPAISKAQQDVVEATKLDSLANQVAKHPEEAVNQKRLAVQLERVSAGRFTVQALDYVIKAGWGNTIQQWINNPKSGALPDDIVKQLVDGAHENLKASKDALQEAIKGSAGSPDSGQTSGKPKDAIGTVAHAGKNYWVDADGNNLGVAP